MEIINTPEEGSNLQVISSQDQSVLSLNELIAKIDSETENLSIHDKSKEEIPFEPDKGPTSLQDQFILFAIEKSLFALPLSSALEIGRRPDITLLPNLPNWVLGISNVRGEIISFISLKAFFGIPSSMHQ